MFKITVACVGKLKESYWREAVAEYQKRLGAYCSLDVVEVEEAPVPQKASSAQIEAAPDAPDKSSAGRTGGIGVRADGSVEDVLTAWVLLNQEIEVSCAHLGGRTKSHSRGSSSSSSNGVMLKRFPPQV